jgi:hypothetical protein
MSLSCHFETPGPMERHTKERVQLFEWALEGVYPYSEFQRQMMMGESPNTLEKVPWKPSCYFDFVSVVFVSCWRY